MANATETEAPVLRVKRLEHHDGLPLPAAQTAGSAGLDIVAAVQDEAPIVLEAGTRALVPTGLVFELPDGFEAQVRTRSGLALRHGVTVLNSPGTIDADFRGEVQVLLVNLGNEPFTVRRGDRIAQIVVQPVSQPTVVEVAETRQSERGSGGFGSTGVGGPRGKRRET